MSFYNDIGNNEFWSFDKPLLDLMKLKKYRDLWKPVKALNPLVLIRDFLIDLDLIKDWTEYCKMRLEMGEVKD